MSCTLDFMHFFFRVRRMSRKNYYIGGPIMTNIISGSSTAQFQTRYVLKKCPLLPKLIEISKVITLDSNEMIEKKNDKNFNQNVFSHAI